MKNLTKNPFFFVGIIHAIFALVVEGFLPSWQKIHYNFAGFIVIFAVILLFVKKYRYIGKGFLIGLFGTLVLVTFSGLFVTMILSLVSK